MMNFQVEKCKEVIKNFTESTGHWVLLKKTENLNIFCLESAAADDEFGGKYDLVGLSLPPLAQH